MQLIDDTASVTNKLNFLWLELTSRCNLRCVHCYADSEPSPASTDRLSADDYHKQIDSAAQLGCRNIQFIGGEPTLNRALPDFIRHARSAGYEFIEVFTNATRLPTALLDCFVEHKVCVATSFYSHLPAVHDSITQQPGSFASTVEGIRNVLQAGLRLRAGIIVMDQNRDTVTETTEFLHSLGVKEVGVDRVRSFGRATEVARIDENQALSELCGSCWRDSVCISPDGRVAPCIMAKQWTVGSVLEMDLAQIVHGPALRDVRQKIHDEVWMPKLSASGAIPTSIHKPGELVNCGPGCQPNCVPMCNPQCSPNCSPCFPYGKCNPDLFGG